MIKLFFAGIVAVFFIWMVTSCSSYQGGCLLRDNGNSPPLDGGFGPGPAPSAPSVSVNSAPTTAPAPASAPSAPAAPGPSVSISAPCVGGSPSGGQTSCCGPNGQSIGQSGHK